MKLLGKVLVSIGASLVLILAAAGVNAKKPLSRPGDEAGDHSIASDSGKELALELFDEFVAESVTKGTQGNGPRFKDLGERGRPSLFGDPGVPAIGPPGQSGY